MSSRARISFVGGRRFPPHAGTARSNFSAASGQRRQWRGASCSTSCTIGGRSLPTCARWDRPSRRSTDRAGTSRSSRLRARRNPHPGRPRSTTVHRAARKVLTKSAHAPTVHPHRRAHDALLEEGPMRRSRLFAVSCALVLGGAASTAAQPLPPPATDLVVVEPLTPEQDRELYEWLSALEKWQRYEAKYRNRPARDSMG